MPEEKRKPLRTGSIYTASGSVFCGEEVKLDLRKPAPVSDFDRIFAAGARTRRSAQASSGLSVRQKE
jgi:hypothetical protein